MAPKPKSRYTTDPQERHGFEVEHCEEKKKIQIEYLVILFFFSQ